MLKDERVEVKVSEGDDLLGQRAAIATLVRAVKALEPPACIAVYGPWGSGKTNILHNARLRLQHPNQVTVWFDPWQYDRQPDLLGPLLQALLTRARGFKGDPERLERLKRHARGFLRAARTVVARLATRKAVNLVGEGVLALGDFSDDPPEGVDGGVAGAPEASEQEEAAVAADVAAIDRWLDGIKDTHDAVEAVKRRFAGLVEATLALATEESALGTDGVLAPRRVVFFLDDLDRCLPDRVVELIEHVKLLLCGAPKCQAVFVFALDRRIVGEAIRHRFPGASQYSGENYLEKIFDFSMETPPLPEAPADVTSFVEYCVGGPRSLESVCKPFGNTGPLLEALAVAPLANPRVIKRTLNRLGLLQMTFGGEVRETLRSIGSPSVYKRCLVWLAGAERFHMVRHFIRVADWDELRATLRVLDISLLKGDEVTTAADRVEALSPEGQAIVRLPGVRSYLRALDPMRKVTGNSTIAAFSKPHDFPNGPPPGSLKWFDDLMRAAGL